MAAISTTVSAGQILALIVARTANTRSTICRTTGLSRSTVADRLEALFDAGLIVDGAETPSSGGRRSKELQLNHNSRLTLAADIGEDHVRLILTDLAATIIGEVVGELAVAQGPETVLSWIASNGRDLVKASGRDISELVGIGLAVPAPVDYARGEIAGPSVMIGWEGVNIEAVLRRDLDVPVVVENDVNARGLGEYLQSWSEFDQVFYVKAGTGIGSAILTNGALFRGAQGAAGDIGHIRLEPIVGPLCRCGNVGCVEALAAGWSLVRDIREAGHDIRDTPDFMALATSNSPEAIQLLRQAGRTLGRAIAYSVNLLNPNIVVVGGSLSAGGEHLLMGIRESVYQYSLPLATRDLQIVTGLGNERTSSVGAAQLVIRMALQPDRVNAALRERLAP